ncbi:MAG: 30S ribosomal protein S6 [Planctomycetes bacterium]|nr:30S ribosomal protein S6 [Planctomycetota bacterium]
MHNATEKQNLYEVMMLVDPGKARQGEEDTVKELRELVTRVGGDVVNLVRWADRELAYPIHKNHQKFTRAVYFLGHFNAPGDSVAQLERVCGNLDWVIRIMVICDQDGTDVPGDTRPTAPDKTAADTQPQPAESSAAADGPDTPAPQKDTAGTDVNEEGE